MVKSFSNPNNTYVIDIENATETARLIDQDGLFTDAMGGLLPEQEEMESVKFWPAPVGKGRKPDHLRHAQTVYHQG